MFISIIAGQTLIISAYQEILTRDGVTFAALYESDIKKASSNAHLIYEKNSFVATQSMFIIVICDF